MKIVDTPSKQMSEELRQRRSIKRLQPLEYQNQKSDQPIRKSYGLEAGWPRQTGNLE